jgi:hypothetical protein
MTGLIWGLGIACASRPDYLRLVLVENEKMLDTASNLRTLIASMSPILNAERVAFVSLAIGEEAPVGIPGTAIIGTFREPEGLTVFLELDVAERFNLQISYRAAWITLILRSDITSAGLTAAFSGALGVAGISCNVVAAAYHDHIFVPLAAAHAAMDVLHQLRREAANGNVPTIQ